MPSEMMAGILVTLARRVNAVFKNGQLSYAVVHCGVPLTVLVRYADLSVIYSAL